MKVNCQIKLTNPQLLFVLCLNIYMAKYLRIDIRFLSAINGARNNTSDCQSDLHEADYYYFFFRKYSVVWTKCWNCICRLTIVLMIIILLLF